MPDESLFRLTIFFGIFFVMVIWEFITPKRSLNYGKKRWPANLGIIIINSLTMKLLLPAGAVGAAIWTHEQQIGLLNMLQLNSMVSIAIAIILLDFIIYTQHRIFHITPILWRLHQVHHADRDIDVTTGLRFHPIEILLSLLIKITAVILLGVPVIAVIIFEVILNAMAMFNHSNIHLPKSLDEQIRKVFVTPDMHRVHHSILQHETNSNYGFNLTIWDYFFASYQSQPEQGHHHMKIGLADFQQAPTHQLSWMLRLPFSSKIQNNKPANKV